MNKSDELLERCFKCKDYPNDCGIYFMMSLWEKECKFFREKMTKYQQFLEKLEVISEDQFDEIVKEFPDIDISLLELDSYDNYDVDDVARAFIEVILRDYDYAYPDELDFKARTISIEDIESLEDLESIKQKFSNWNITNYDERKEYFLQEEEEEEKDAEHQMKINLITNTIDNIPIEDLKEFIEKYDNKR